MDDARTGRFTRLPRMITVRHSHAATMLPDGRVRITGGEHSAAHFTCRRCRTRSCLCRANVSEP